MSEVLSIKLDSWITSWANVGRAIGFGFQQSLMIWYLKKKDDDNIFLASDDLMKIFIGAISGYDLKATMLLTDLKNSKKHLN